MAIQDPDAILQEFIGAIKIEGIVVPAIKHRVFRAGDSHTNRKPKGLPKGYHLVYVFSIGEIHGPICQAGANRVLRIGKATSIGRLTQNYKHYPTGLGLPNKLATYKVLWPFLGLSGVGPGMGTDWKRWIENNLARDQFEIPNENEALVSWLEKFLRGRLGSVFEG